jgi:hypothetical protein
MGRVLAVAGFLSLAPVCTGTFFVPGNLVVSVEGNGIQGATSGPYGDNQAAPLSLFQYSVFGTSTASYVNSMALPQTANGANLPVSGEYGSSSEGALQLSGNGQYLTIMGYGINAATYNQNALNNSGVGTYGNAQGNAALAQSGSVPGQGYTPVARVVATIDQNGNVNSTTGLFNVFSGNNPRSVYSANGTTFYVSGQGTTGDATGGVFYTTLGNSSATSITGLDGGSGSSQDTRNVQIYNGQLYVSVDSKSGATNRDFVGTLGTAGNPPTTVANGGNGPTTLNGFGGNTNRGSVTISGNGNGLNTGKTINLSPEGYFFASPSVLYVADSGSPKNTAGNTSTVGDGGLQKWVNSNADGSGVWTLEYTLAAGLGLVPNSQTDNPAGDDTTGLLGLTGEVINGQVELFATNYTIGDLDPTYLYGITDTLAFTTATQASAEQFAQLAAAPADSNFKGVSFAPNVAATPEPTPVLLGGLGLLALFVAKRKLRERVQG